MEEVKQCPICGGKVSTFSTKYLRSIGIDCNKCGRFVQGKFYPEHQISHYQRGLLGGELCWAKLENRLPFGEEELIIDTTNLDELIAKCPQNLTPADKMDLLLRYYAKLSHYAGDYVERCTHDVFSLYTTQENEFYFILESLASNGLLKIESKQSLRITIKGWNAYYDLVRNRAKSNRAFVAMWFNKDLDDIYEKGFRSALEDEEIGFEARRIDKVPQNDNQKLCDSILAEIRQAQIVVADFTGQRAGVYYEAGFAEGLGIPVIRTCRDDEEEKTKIHFDVSHYPFIFWKDSEDLRKQLKDRILARIDIFRGKDK